MIRLRRAIRLLASLEDVLTDGSAWDKFCSIIRLSTEFIFRRGHLRAWHRGPCCRPMKRNIESPNESCDSGVTETFAGTVSRGKQLNNGKWIPKIHCEKQIVGKVGWKKNAGVSELSSRCYLRQLFFFLAVSWRHSSFRVLRNMNEIPFISVAINSILTLCWRPFGLWLNK